MKFTIRLGMETVWAIIVPKARNRKNSSTRRQVAAELRHWRSYANRHGTYHCNLKTDG